MPRSVAIKLTCHKTESVYRRYAIVAEADLREGVAKLARLRESQAVAVPGPTVVRLHPFVGGWLFEVTGSYRLAFMAACVAVGGLGRRGVVRGTAPRDP